MKLSEILKDDEPAMFLVLVVMYNIRNENTKLVLLI